MVSEFGLPAPMKNWNLNENVPLISVKPPNFVDFDMKRKRTMFLRHSSVVVVFGHVGIE